LRRLAGMRLGWNRRTRKSHRRCVSGAGHTRRATPLWRWRAKGCIRAKRRRASRLAAAVQTGVGPVTVHGKPPCRTAGRASGP
jgi:hypothetical protein